MKKLDFNSYIIGEDEKKREVERLFYTREKEFFNFFKEHDSVEKDKKELAQNIIENKYLLILNPNSENEKLYNCFSTEQGALDAYKRIPEENKAIAKGNINYHMILGVVFVNKYEVEEYIEFK